MRSWPEMQQRWLLCSQSASHPTFRRTRVVSDEFGNARACRISSGTRDAARGTGLQSSTSCASAVNRPHSFRYHYLESIIVTLLVVQCGMVPCKNQMFCSFCLGHTHNMAEITINRFGSQPLHSQVWPWASCSQL